MQKEPGSSRTESEATMKSCFFIGHRNAPESIQGSLAEAVERHITEYDVKEFIVGQYGAFDRMTQSTLSKAKEQHPDIRLLLLLPYHPAERMVEMPKSFDGAYYPRGMETVPKRYAIERANRATLKTVDYLICYDRRYVGSTRELVDIALRREREGLIHVENLATTETRL